MQKHVKDGTSDQISVNSRSIGIAATDIRVTNGRPAKAPSPEARRRPQTTKQPEPIGTSALHAHKA
jgi:hypothetical protein